jgi:hypothetical protein
MNLAKFGNLCTKGPASVISVNDRSVENFKFVGVNIKHSVSKTYLQNMTYNSC